MKFMLSKSTMESLLEVKDAFDIFVENLMADFESQEESDNETDIS